MRLLTPGRRMRAFERNPRPHRLLRPRMTTSALMLTQGSGSPPPTQQIKWNPGNYAAGDTNGTILAGYDGGAAITEAANCIGYSNILGFRVLAYWPAFENETEGSYSFTALDQLVTYMSTGVNESSATGLPDWDNVPRRVVIRIVGFLFGGAWYSGDDRIVPQYIQNSTATYGDAPVSGTAGWWDVNGNGTGVYALNLCNDNVAARFQAFMEAMGEHYDGNEWVESIELQELSDYAGDLSGPGGPYNDSTFISNMEAIGTTMVDSFPTTNVSIENTWIDFATSTQQYEQFMIDNRIAAGSADTLGQTAMTYSDSYKTSSSGMAWGLQAYLGIQASGSTWSPPDPALYTQISSFMDIEAPDLLGGVDWQGLEPNGWTAQDLLNALNETYVCSHAYWTCTIVEATPNYNDGTAGADSPWACWDEVSGSGYPGLGTFINENSLTNTSYPSGYPS